MVLSREAIELKKTKKVNSYTLILIAFTLAIILFFTIAKGKAFWRGDVWAGMLVQFPEYGCIALGMMFCFISDYLDLSCIMLSNLANILMIKFLTATVVEGMSNSEIGRLLVIGILIAFGISLAGALVNSFLVTYMNIPPVMATVSTQMVWLGISTALTKGDTVTGLPSLYTTIGHMKFFGWLPLTVLVFAGCFLITGFILNYTVYGKRLFMLGSNQKAVAYSGINHYVVISVCMILCAFMSTVGGLIMTSTLSSAKADYGTSYIMRCFLILMLAGVDAGKGKMINVLITTFTIQIIATGVNLFSNFNTYVASVIWGGMLLIVLVLTTYMTDDGFSFPFVEKLKKKKLAKAAEQ